jgi:hypothetical protein
VLCVWVFSGALSAAEPRSDVCVVVGAPGEESFATGFANAAHAWEQAAAGIGAACTVIGLAPEDASADRDRLREWIAAHANPAADTTAWIVYLGHGTYDGREARLNLRGPDVTAQDLAGWLERWSRPLVFVHGGSASAPFLAALSRPDRIVIAATRSGGEANYARFGERFAAAVANPAADIDRDGQTSVLEAFVTAAQQVQSFYAENGRLATEHALIDDNGDQQGTPAEWFHGVRLQRRPEGSAQPDGDRARLVAFAPSPAERALTAEQRAERDRLEAQIEALRARKPTLPGNDYYRQLETILRQLGTLYRAGDS